MRRKRERRISGKWRKLGWEKAEDDEIFRDVFCRVWLTCLKLIERSEDMFRLVLGLTSHLHLVAKLSVEFDDEVSLVELSVEFVGDVLLSVVDELLFCGWISVGEV